ncbi:MAG: ester cyclase [Bryobacteraceae bacterium]|nr:ester cyclase [Bryobacteraceae bacterium]
MQTQSEISENVKLARRFVEGVLGGADPQAFDELVADNVWVSTGLKPDAPITSKAEYGRVLSETLGKAFSEGDMKIDELLETSDGRVVVRFTATALHSGELYGVPPTGKRVVFAEMHLLRFADGKLVENFVGGLNPLSYEMIFADYIKPLVLS